MMARTPPYAQPARGGRASCRRPFALTYSADAAIDDAITSVPGLQAETLSFATSYAGQVDSDWQAYVAAKNSGRPLF